MAENAVKKLEKMKSDGRRRAKSYYARHFTFWDGMTAEERENVEYNISQRKIENKKKYQAKADYYKQRQKEYRQRKKKSLTARDVPNTDNPINKKLVKNPKVVVNFS